MADQHQAQTPALETRRVFRWARARDAWQGATIVFALFFLLLCVGLAVLPAHQRLGFALLVAPIVPFLGWISHWRFRHRNDHVEVDESQIAYAGPDRRLALAWDEIGEIKGSMEYLILRPRNCEARRELRIPDSILDPSDEFIVLLHRYCPVARGVSRGAVTLPWVFREARGKRVLRWTATVALLALALGLLLAGNPILTLVGLLLLAAELLLALFTLITPSFAMVTKEDVTLRSPLRSWKLRHDEIEEIVPAPPWVRVVSRGKGFAFHCPGLTLLATYDLLVTAWESAGHGKEQST